MQVGLLIEQREALNSMMIQHPGISEYSENPVEYCLDFPQYFGFLPSTSRHSNKSRHTETEYSIARMVCTYL